MLPAVIPDSGSAYGRFLWIIQRLDAIALSDTPFINVLFNNLEGRLYVKTTSLSLT
jgi:hypothetical protein